MDYRVIDNRRCRAIACSDDVPEYTLADMERVAERLAIAEPGIDFWVQSRAGVHWQDESNWRLDPDES